MVLRFRGLAMNQEGPRLRFKQNINEYIKDVELSDQFVALLRTHPCSDELDDILVSYLVQLIIVIYITNKFYILL